MSVWGGGFIQAGAAKSAAKQQAAAMREAIAEQRRQYELNVQRLNPYEEFGRGRINFLTDVLARKPEIDPGYDWRREQGLKGVEGSAAGSGMIKSGDTLRALEQYGQGLASQEYGNAFARKMQEAEMERNLVGGGQNAAVQQGSFGQQSAQNITGLQKGIGQAEAQGTIGAANAWAGLAKGLGGLASSGLGAYMGSGGATPGGSNIFASGGGGAGGNMMADRLGASVPTLGEGSDYWSQYLK